MYIFAHSFFHFQGGGFNKSRNESKYCESDDGRQYSSSSPLPWNTLCDKRLDQFWWSIFLSFFVYQEDIHDIVELDINISILWIYYNDWTQNEEHVFLGRMALAILQRWTRAIIEGVMKEVVEQVKWHRGDEYRCDDISLNAEYITICSYNKDIAIARELLNGLHKYYQHRT